ncbi:glycosyltransferase family 4 protein [Mesorhizobium sp. CAU 1741]|uniref:glycosyltransferase family 4 protein n=1 Tax=Mesorhizobium sp. CAU 1741 TaxID=3140366 RepID=UPI00325BF1E9
MSSSLRIVHCFRSPVGGIFRHVRDLVHAQAAAGHQVGIICDSSTGGQLEDDYFNEIRGSLALGVQRITIHRQIGPGDIAAGWQTYELIKALRPDVLHGHGAKGGALARLFGSLLRVSRYRVARIYSPHGGVLHYDAASTKGKVLFALERLLGRFTDQILFVSEHERRTYLAKVGQPRSASSLVYNGVNEAEFVPVAPGADAADFLYIGMMRDLKGPDLFIDALAASTRDLGRPIKAVMVGDGDGLERYKAQTKALGLAGDVRFFPPMPARKAFALARIIVVPSRAEAMPYIVLEALAAGKTMISSAVGGIPEIFSPTSPALVQPEAKSLAAAMTAALRDEAAFAAHMPAQDELRARFSASVMARDVERAYHEALGRAS